MRTSGRDARPHLPSTRRCACHVRSAPLRDAWRRVRGLPRKSFQPGGGAVRVTRALTMGIAALLVAGSAADAASPEVSTGDRLKDRRVVAAGERATALGFADGRFYANGWHIAGEMGGIWSTPLKLADGVWFGIDDEWVGQATRFSSGWGYTR